MHLNQPRIIAIAAAVAIATVFLWNREVAAWMGIVFAAGLALLALSRARQYYEARTRRTAETQRELERTIIALTKPHDEYSLEDLNNERTIIVIGRGHSGTRAISSTLQKSGVFMGAPLNPHEDLVPSLFMYEACKYIGRHVKYRGGLEWDFDGVHRAEVDPGFERLLKIYLSSLFPSTAEYRGWKIPETTLAYPWVVKLLPRAKYIYWIRDPRDSILGQHGTDDIRTYDVPLDAIDDLYRRRAASWKYHYDVVRSTPEPEHFISVRFEDFVLRQDESLEALSPFLGIDLAKVPVRPQAVGRYKRANVDLKVDDLVPLWEGIGTKAGAPS